MKIRVTGNDFDPEDVECVSWKRINFQTIGVQFEDKYQTWWSERGIKVKEV